MSAETGMDTDRAGESGPRNAAASIAAGRTALGIELGSTRIKACLIDADTSEVLATGGFEWENQYVDGRWTYDLDTVWHGIASAYAALARDARDRHGAALTRVGTIGVSAMMHGYLAFDAEGRQLVDFRTWRNTSTAAAAAELSERFGRNIPLRWSVAHLYQAVLDREPHLERLAFCTTLAGYVHWRLTGERVLGIGDASGMFPIDDATRDYDAACLASMDELLGDARLIGPMGAGLRGLLPLVRPAGADAGSLTAAGAALLDPRGDLQPGAPCCPPEGDAGTGMVATNAIAPRSGNVSVGTSVFAMVVLEGELRRAHAEIDLVTTPAGDPVAMVHCNNGASELAAWTGVFAEFARAAGLNLQPDDAFAAMFAAAASGATDAGGLLAYNQLAGEPVVDLAEGRPLVVRAPGSAFTLANFARAQLYGVFAALTIGMEVLAAEDVAIDRMQAHGGVFRSGDVAQQVLADALDAPVAISETAAEGGAWGMAVLAAYRIRGEATPLQTYLAEHVFAGTPVSVLQPRSAATADYRAYLSRYRLGLAAERAAASALPAL